VFSQVRKEERREEKEIGERLREIFGAVILIVGVFIAVWVCINLFRIFTNPRSLEVFREIIPSSPSLRVLEIDGKEVLLPESIFSFFAYVIGLAILFVTGMIATSFISSGINLMVGNVMRVEMRINRAIEGLKKRIDDIREQVSRKSDSV
jgi:hypothetical protein